MTATLSVQDRTLIDRDTHCRCIETITPPTSPAQFDHGDFPPLNQMLDASVIITGLSPKIAQTLVTLGVDLSKIHTMGDLQGGLEEAERLLGYTVTREAGATSS